MKFDTNVTIAIAVFLSVGSTTLLAQENQQAAEQAFRRAVVKTKASTTGFTDDAEQSTKFPSFDQQFPPPTGVKAFELSQAYPGSYDVNEVFPWSDIDFRSNGASYMRAVLGYCLEGNTEVDFRGHENQKRIWYHAPWLHDDSELKDSGKRQGREYHHGMTRERRSRKFELHPFQTTDKIQNWAVSLYNPRGGYTIGKVWLTPDGFPDPSKATFPDNTVSFKLLFSAAPQGDGTKGEEVPFLKDSFKWTANINPDTPVIEGKPFTRVDREMRLLQVDVAVKDPRVANGTGWIFGTFVYDASQPGTDPFKKLVPVGLSWGDDEINQNLPAKEKELDLAYLEKEGTFLNERLKESSVNASLIQPPTGVAWGNRAYLTHFGLGGRLNGPVDNPFSSCISCHGRAGTYESALPLSDNSGLPMPILAGTGDTTGTKSKQKEKFDQFFKNIRPNSHVEIAEVGDLGSHKFVTVDYSLQLSQGIRNFYQSMRLNKEMLESLREALGPSSSFVDTAPTLKKLPEVSRDESDR